MRELLANILEKLSEILVVVKLVAFDEVAASVRVTWPPLRRQPSLSSSIVSSLSSVWEVCSLFCLPFF